MKSVSMDFITCGTKGKGYFYVDGVDRGYFIPPVVFSLINQKREKW